MELRTKRVNWADIAVTVREESGLDTFKEPHLFWDVVKAVYEKDMEYQDIPLVERNKLQEFTAMISRTVCIEGNLGFEWPKADSPKEALKVGFEGLDMLAGGLVRLWRNAINELTVAPMGDPELAPASTLSDKKKEA